MGGDIAIPRALVLALIVVGGVGIFGIGLAVGSLIGDSVPPVPTATPTLAAETPSPTGIPQSDSIHENTIPPEQLAAGPLP